MRIVVVGLGVQGRKRRTIAGNQVVATVDPVAANADYRSIDEVPLTRFDAACVCVPDGQKLPILRYLLGHQKHVLVEKPLLAKASEIQELLELSRRNKAVCYTAYNHRFEPHIARLKQIVDSQKLGQLYLVKIFYGNGTARDVRNSVWRDQGLGVVSDLGSHMLDMVLFLLGPSLGVGCESSPSAPPEERAGERRPLTAHTGEVQGKTPVRMPQIFSINRFENRAPDHVLFGFSGRPMIELEATMISWRNTFGLDVYGELGSSHIQCLCKWGPSTLTVRQRILPSGRPEETVETLEQPDPTWKLEYDYFLLLCQRAGSNLENDLWIGEKIEQLS